MKLGFTDPMMADMAERQVTNSAVANLELELIRKDLADTRRKLEQTKQELADYRAEQNRKSVEQEAKQAEIEKQNVRRGWAQVVVTCILSGLVSWVVAYLQVKTWG